MRQLYSVKKDLLGMAFSPANNASPSSKTWLITWPCLAFPKSFRAKRDLIACSAGIIFDPGKPAKISPSGSWAKYGRNRKRPPHFVRKLRYFIDKKPFAIVIIKKCYSVGINLYVNSMVNM
jgi:hypothetical protein